MRHVIIMTTSLTLALLSKDMGRKEHWQNA